MPLDLRGDLVTSVAEVAWILIEDGVPEDNAIAMAMDDVYTIPLWGPPGWKIMVCGLCPTAMFPNLRERWVFEFEVWECVKGEWNGDVPNQVL